MLGLVGSRRFPSRHLVIIPKSTHRPDALRIPGSVAGLRRELTRLMKNDSVSPNERFIEAITALSRKCGPREIQKLVIVMDIHGIFSSELKAYIIDRVKDLGARMPLHSLLTVNSKFASGPVLDLIRQRINAEEVSRLANNKLVSLVMLVPDSGLVLSELRKRVKKLDLCQIATSLNGLKKFGRSSPSINQFVETVTKDLPKRLLSDDSVSPRDIALIFNALGHFGSVKCSSDITKSLIDHTVPRFDKFSPMQQALVLHSLTKLEFADFRLFDLFVSHFNPINFKGSSKAVSMILYAMGKSEFKNDAFLTNISELIKRDIDSFDFQSLALSCYGFSRLGFLPRGLLTVVAEEIVYRTTVKRNSKSLRYTIADIGMISKAFSQSSKRTGREYTQLSYTLVEMLKNHPGGKRRDPLTPTVDGVVSVIEAFSFLDRSRVVGFDFWISKNLHPVVHHLTCLQIYSVITAMVKMGVTNKPLYEAILGALNPDLVDYKLVPKMVTKMSKIPSSSSIDSLVIKKLGKVFSINLFKYTEMFDLAGMLYGLSELNYRDEILVNRTIGTIKILFDKESWIDDSVLPMLVLAAARLRITDNDFNEKMYGKVFKSINAFESERSITNTLYAIATSVGSGDLDPSVVHWIYPIVNELLGRLIDRKDLPLEAIRQVQVVGLWLRLMSGKNSRIPGRIEAWLDDIQTMNTYKSSSVEQSSESHREISRYLLQLGLPHTNEVIFGPFSLDIYVPETRTIIEIDGPHHFFRDTVTRTSSSVLKHKLLECMGYKLIHVPFQEWIQCTTDSRKLAYCNSIAELVKT